MHLCHRTERLRSEGNRSVKFLISKRKPPLLGGFLISKMKYSEDNMATTNMITSLSEALLRAKAYASMLYGDKEDGGTCNFDTPQLILSGWTEADVESAFSKAGLTCYIKKIRQGSRCRCFRVYEWSRLQENTHGGGCTIQLGGRRI